VLLVAPGDAKGSAPTDVKASAALTPPEPVRPESLALAPSPAPRAPSAGAAAEPAADVSLTIISTPPSNAVLDGRPLGRTPRQVAVPPGNHSVVFIHPTLGRKEVNVTMKRGKPRYATVDF
jgi:serine/threonine-protein kinase